MLLSVLAELWEFHRLVPMCILANSICIFYPLLLANDTT